MGAVRQGLRSAPAHPLPRVGLAALLLLGPGCKLLDTCPTCADPSPPVGTPCQVVTTWGKQVQYTPDTERNGAPMPGLVGRLYLFGPTIDYPMAGDGGVVVDLYDEPGRTFRVIPRELWGVENNLSLANMDYSDFADNVDADGVFRGFPRP